MDTTWSPGRTLEDIERAVILSALQFYRGNKTQTAEALKIAVRTIHNRIATYKKAGIAVPFEDAHPLHHE